MEGNRKHLHRMKLYDRYLTSKTFYVGPGPGNYTIRKPPYVTGGPKIMNSLGLIKDKYDNDIPGPARYCNDRIIRANEV